MNTMNIPLILPQKIAQLVGGKTYTADQTGLSGAKVMLFDDSVLRITPADPRNEQTVHVMQWLQGRLPAPRVIAFEQEADHQYLLMSRVTGTMACDDVYLSRPKVLIPLLAEAMQMLWHTDPDGCPRTRGMDTELAEAADRVERGLVDMENTGPGAFGKGGFRDPEALLRWLIDNRPEEEPVLSHGDFCLPNLLLENDRISGFIDLDTFGIGDRWRDIADCCGSLQRNAQGAYGGKVYPDCKADLLFSALGIRPDTEKLRWYQLLDALF